MSATFNAQDRADAIYALAACWASIDGKLEVFGKERELSLDQAVTGHYEGYMAEAEEMLNRLERRGFTINRLVAAVRHAPPQPPEGEI